MTNKNIVIHHSLKESKTYTIDNVFVKFDNTMGKFFFYNNPTIKTSDKKQSDQLKKTCLVELRMKPETFWKMALEIAEAIMTFEPDFIKMEKQEKQKNNIHGNMYA